MDPQKDLLGLHVELCELRKNARKVQRNDDVSTEIAALAKSQQNKSSEIKRACESIKSDLDNVIHGPRSTNSLLIGKDNTQLLIDTKKKAEELFATFKIKNVCDFTEEIDFSKEFKEVEQLEKFEEKLGEFISLFKSAKTFFNNLDSPRSDSDDSTFIDGALSIQSDNVVTSSPF